MFSGPTAYKSGLCLLGASGKIGTGGGGGEETNISSYTTAETAGAS